MTLLTCVGLFLPLLSFLLLMIFSSSISRKMAGRIACGSVFVSFLSFASILANYVGPIKFTLFEWLPFKGIEANFTLAVDTLTLVMTLIITGVGFLIHVYSIGYMEYEEDYARYFACLNFFIFAMLLLVLSAHLLLLFVGWEGVGLASYLLIGFWYQRPKAAQAATKAFVVNRIGDFSLLVGLILTFTLFGTGDIDEITQKARGQFAVGAPLITLITLLYFGGATGKSAQIPLHTWLPDAMEGPTPVSALIHAATMVTAGVYLLVRMHTLFALSPLTLQVVGVIGAITSLFAAICALGQTDLKRVLAYSTVSQLGLMFLACGAGAFYAAMFHLTSHAFIKALLFLSAGNVVHMMHNTTEMAQMGGLKRQFPKTKNLFLIGVLAMSGFPPFAAFFSKDLILEQEHMAGLQTLYLIGLLASVLTGFYLMRAYCLTFLGEPRDLESVKEAPKIMLRPVIILACLSILGGGLGFAFSKVPILETFLAKADITLENPLPPGSYIWSKETLFSIIGALLGVGAAYVIYTNYSDRLGRTLAFLKKAFFIDEIYDALFVKPLKMVSKFISVFVEPKVMEGTVRGVTNTTNHTAALLQLIQSGQIRSYVAWMVAGAAILLIYYAF